MKKIIIIISAVNNQPIGGKAVIFGNTHPERTRWMMTFAKANTAKYIVVGLTKCQRQ